MLFDAYVHGRIDRRGFNNDTTPRYDAAAAKLAWDRTIAFFKASL
ncbi:MAG TPA: dienelactone hydrolase family protein [Ramlibacter sp.]